MSILHCTARLYERLVEADVPDCRGETNDSPAPPRLGDWTATLLALRPARLVLAVSEHADLPVVLSGEETGTIVQRLPEAVYRLLLDIDVPADLARRERDAMQPLQPQPTHAGKPSAALGPLKVYGIELRSVWERGLSRVPAELALHLAAQVSEYLDGSTPAQAARRRLHLLPDHTEPLGL